MPTNPSADLLTPHKHRKLVLTPSFKQGAFDSHGVDCPFLFSHEGRHWMTYVGWDGEGYQTGLASSEDLVEWNKEGLLIGRGAADSHIAHNVALTSILRENDLFSTGQLKQVEGRFVGTYHAYPDPGYEAGPGVIGLAFSEDLRNWEVGPPVLEPGTGGEWEAGGLYKSWLLENDGMWYLFYNAKNRTASPWVERTGFAWSKDLVEWHRNPSNPVLDLGAEGAFDDCFASDPCVLRYQDTWCLFYFGLCSDGHAREGVAFSRDLMNWQKSGEILVDVGPPGSVDSRHAHKPGMIWKSGRLYHFYCAVAPVENAGTGEVEPTEIRGITLATN